MKKHLQLTVLLVIFSTLYFLNCSSSPKEYSETNPASLEKIKLESKRLNDFFEKKFNEKVDRYPTWQSYLGIKKDYDKLDNISDEMEMKENEITRQDLQELKTFNMSLLDEQTKLSYRLWEYNAKQSIEFFPFRHHEYIVNQLFGVQSDIPSFMINIHQITSLSDAEAYIQRLRDFKRFFSQVIDSMKISEEKGIIPPKFVFPQVIQDSKNLIQGEPFDRKGRDNTLLADFKSKVNGLSKLSGDTKLKLIEDAKNALRDFVKPAYEDLITYLKTLELKATTDDGAWKLPDGEDYYLLSLKEHTTTDYDPDDIHNIGLKEVERIHAEMQKIMDQVQFKGSLPDFFKNLKSNPQFKFANNRLGREAYLEKTKKIINNMEASLNQYFGLKPKKKLRVKRVEAFREKSTTGAFYEDPSPDGSRPGTYFVNLYDMNQMPKYEMEALAYHEGIPGHHMQISISQDLKTIPKFRKYSNHFTAYVEGWGLYSEFIPKEMGMYKDPYSDFGRLSMELFRACRLVVDTGIHSKKWTREKAIAYLSENTPSDPEDNRHEIERYIVDPGQATAYKIGQLKILELREKAKKKLGAKFDIKKFHDVVLENGGLPLNILEEVVENNLLKSKN